LFEAMIRLLQRRRVNDPGMSRYDDVAIEEDVE
jgi:hypothetical protein